MTKRWLVFAGLAVFLGPVAVWLLISWATAPRESIYQERTTSQWLREIEQWEVSTSVWNQGGRLTFWDRMDSPWEKGLKAVGFKIQLPTKLPLLEGDPATVPVLLALLKDENPKARRVAIQGLEAIGQFAKEAVPALVEALEDRDEDVRRDAEQALFSVDRETAENCGLEWTMFGLERHPNGKRIDGSQ